MKFLIDENLPLILSQLFTTETTDGYHINQLKSHSKQHVSDQQINKLALYKDYIIVTRDDDFVHTHVSRNLPEKLVFVFIKGSKKDIVKALATYLDEIIIKIQSVGLIEVNEEGIRFPLA